MKYQGPSKSSNSLFGPFFCDQNTVQLSLEKSYVSRTEPPKCVSEMSSRWNRFLCSKTAKRNLFLDFIRNP